MTREQDEKDAKEARELVEKINQQQTDAGRNTDITEPKAGD